MSEIQFLDEAIKALGWQGGTIHQVLDEIKRLKSVEPKWLPVETAPDDGTPILSASLSEAGNYHCKCVRWEDNSWVIAKFKKFTVSWEPTHWMKLPPKPSK